MGNTPIFFELGEVPDPDYSPFRNLTKNPRSAMWEAMQHLVRFIGDLPPHSVTVCIRFILNPNPRALGPQTRLRVLVGVRGRSKKLTETLAKLLIDGPVSRFFPLRPVSAPSISSKLTACCHITRSHAAATPLTSPEFNVDVPDKYFTCIPFQPNEQNEYLSLDRVLDGVDEQALLDICIEPTNIAPPRESHSRYLERLQSIHRPRAWSSRDVMTTDEDPLADDVRTSQDRLILTPLHRPDGAAQDVRRIQQLLQETFRQPYLAFHMIAMAKTTATARLIGSTLAENAFQDGSYDVRVHARKEDIHRIRAGVKALKTIKRRKISALNVQCGILGNDPLVDLLYSASVQEMLGAFRLPVAGSGSPLCMRCNTDPPHVDDKELIILGHDLRSTRHLQRTSRGIGNEDMVLSAFLTGLPGKGKTTSEIHLATQLCGRGVPLLMIECAKTEMRALKRHCNHKDPAVRRLARGMHIYTPGNEMLSPLRHSLLEVGPGMSVAGKIDSLSKCFEAAMPMGGPLSSILIEALEDTYDSAKSLDRSPSIEDLMRAARAAVRRKQYSSSTSSDLEAALETRLGRLTRGAIGPVFRCSRSLPAIDDIFHSYTAIELEWFDDSYCSCLFTLSLLTQLRAALRSMPPAKTVPRLVVFISEAHRILGRSSGAAPSEDNPDPKAYVVETLCQMLAELRALGVGVVISDQTPSALAPEVINLTGTKLAFQLVANADREAIGGAMLFGQDEYDNIARLRTGEAYLFTKGYYAPRLIKTINIHEVL
ncbi:MAG: ATP-binding protein [Verrucomicrobia bacterium]|jgi:hypothetical protein|nr:ATP-binding protein [Verrucomicrobiota bacterium]